MSIWKPVNDRIVQASRETETEIIGLLLGRLEDNTIIIEDSITGEFSAETNRVILPSKTLAKIADDFIGGRIKGNIVGWYHSHTESGLFFSDTDIETQRKLQQFSSLITAMVVDATTGDVGYFRLDPRTGRPTQVSNERIRIFAEPSEAVSPEAAAKPAVRPTPTIEVRARPPRPRQPMTMLMLSAILIALAASLLLLGAVLYRGMPAGPPLTINHSPVAGATIGTPIEIIANVTGPVRNTTLFYAVAGSSSFSQVGMISPSTNQYQYVIPGQEVTGSISYFIKAADTLGNSMQTPTYHIAISDFAFQTYYLALTVYRTRSAVAEFSLLAINGFNQQVSLSATGAPQGLTVSFSPNPTSPSTAVDINAATDSTTPNGTYPIVITAKYTPPNAPAVTRQVVALVTVADFDLQVSPTSKLISKGATATYDLVLYLQRGFVDPVMIAVSGLPQGATFQMAMNGNTIVYGGPGMTALTLQIITTSSIKSGTYDLTVTGTGAGIIHSQNIQLIVR